METLLQDLRYGFRMLRKSPGFTAVAVLTLALGLGANTAVFSIVDALALRPLPVPDAKHLVAIYTSGKTSRGAYLTGPTSYPDLVDYRAGAPAFAGIAGSENRGSILRVGDDSVMLLTCVVTENYFSLLGVNALHGRTFTEQEFQSPDFPPEVVISYSLWRKYLGGDPKVVGRNIHLTGKDYVIAGVLPREFRGTEPTASPDIFMPALVWGREEMTARSNARFQLLARLNPGVDLRQAQTQMDTVAQRLAAAYPKERSGRVITLQWEPETRRGLRNIGYMFLAVAALVLLIACANVAGLLLARGETRRRELATRLAIGASRLRLTRQMLTESLLLSLLGMGLAVLVALWVVEALPGMLPAQVAMLGIDFRLDQRALAFSFAAALLSLIVFGVAPAVQSCRVSLVSELKEGGSAGTARGRTWARNTLIVGQMALSVVLLTGAGLLVRTFLKVSQQDLGFDSRGQMLLLQILPGSRQSEVTFSTAYPQLLERIEALPGVEGASLGNRAPFADYNGGWRKTVYVPGMHLAPNEQGVPINLGRADGKYFQTLGMALLRGRTFGPQDQPTAQRVVILNETAARRLFPGADPVGQHFRFGGPNGPDCEVVGIVRDAKYNDVTEQIMPYMYVPFAQETGDTVLLVKTRIAAASVLPLVRREIKAFDSSMSIFSVVTMAEHMRAALYAQRATAGLVLTLGLLGLTLAVVGLYGVLSYYVNRRRHEIGLRLAVGAQPGAVFRMIVRRGLSLAALGTAIGMAGAIGVMYFLAGLLFGVSPHDPLTLLVVAGLLLLVAVLAAAVPARRAARVDPMVALRYE
jgi:putative ABC transport system permease protein